MTDRLVYFCGGPWDGTVLPYGDIITSTRLRINEYVYSSNSRPLDNGDKLRVFHFNGDAHACSWRDAEIGVGMQGPTLVEQLWAEIDAGYYKLNNDNTITADQTENLKGYLRGIAFALAKFMQPHFNTADDIVRETHKRHVMATAGEPYETPGTGSRRQESPVGSGFVRTTEAPSVIKHNFTEAQIGKIKAGLQNGFSAEDLAGMYNVKPDVIRSL